MNKFGIFAVALLVCLLFVNSALAIRNTDSLSARLAVRKQKLKVEDVEAGEEKAVEKAIEKSVEKSVEKPSSGSTTIEDLQQEVKDAMYQLDFAEENLKKVIKHAKIRARELAIEKVKREIEEEIEKMKEREEEKEKMRRAARAAYAVLMDPATLDEIVISIEKKVQSEVIRLAHEESVERQVSKELADQIVRNAELARNETAQAQSRAAKNVVEALKDAATEVKRAETASKLAEQQLKKGVEEALLKAEDNYSKLISTPPKATPVSTSTTSTKTLTKTSAKATETPKAGLIQMANIKKLKQQLKAAQ